MRDGTYVVVSMQRAAAPHGRYTTILVHRNLGMYLQSSGSRMGL